LSFKAGGSDYFFSVQACKITDPWRVVPDLIIIPGIYGQYGYTGFTMLKEFIFVGFNMDRQEKHVGFVSVYVKIVNVDLKGGHYHPDQEVGYYQPLCLPPPSFFIGVWCRFYLQNLARCGCFPPILHPTELLSPSRDRIRVTVFPASIYVLYDPAE
jgi:hypothetical protein